MAVAAASPQGYYQYAHSPYPSYYQQYEPSKIVERSSQYAPAPQYHHAAPVVSYAPAPAVSYAPAAPVAAPAAPGFNLETLKSLIPSGGNNLAKASDSLDNLMKGLPAALKNMDPAVKADFRKVNALIADVCNKMVNEAKPESYSYYTPEGIKVTCDFINKTANDIVLGLDDPAIIQSYVDKLKQYTNALNDQSEVYSILF